MVTVTSPIMTNTAGQPMAATNVLVRNPDGTIASLPVNSFGPTSFTFTAAGQQLIMPCAGAASVLFEMSGTFTGTLSTANSADTDTGVVSPSRLWKSGVGSIGRSVIAGTGALMRGQYRGVAGGSIYVISADAGFSGSATVSLFATNTAPIAFVHGAVHSSDEEALRAGRAYTTTTGVGAVASGNHMVLYISNPADSGVRLFIPVRRFTACRQDNLTQVCPQFYGISNPTGNIPTGVGTISSRGDGSIASTVVSRFAVVNDANLPSGGTTAAGNLAVEPDLDFERTLEPGKSFAQVMSNTTSGALGGAFTILMCITAAFYAEPI